MAATLVETLEQQHRELSELVEQINVEIAKRRATELPRLVSRFATALTAHLELEDSGLYPALTNPAQGNVSASARSFATAMLQISGTAKEFLAKYPGPEIPLDDFARGWRSISKVLAARMRAEETSLFPLHRAKPAA